MKTSSLWATMVPSAPLSQSKSRPDNAASEVFVKTPFKAYCCTSAPSHLLEKLHGRAAAWETGVLGPIDHELD